MSAKPRLPAVAWLLLIVATAVYVAWGLFPDSAFYRDARTRHVLLATAALLKIGSLLVGALLAFACRDRLEEGNPARPAWVLLATGLFMTLAGQLGLAPHQLVSGETPFPSVADLFYVLSYPFLISAFLVFLRAHQESGFSTSSLTERFVIVTTIAVVGGAAAVHMLRPVASGGGEVLDRMLNVAYPVLDLVLLMPLALLVRMAMRMRGSHVGGVWALLLAGFVCLSIGDISFAYFSTLGEQHLDPYVHATFLLSYGLITGGAYKQLQLLKS